MTFVCLWSPAWQFAAGSDETERETRETRLVRLSTMLLTAAPRVCVSSGPVVFADARGLNARVLAGALLDLMHDDGVSDACAGIAMTPIAAELAARNGSPGITVVDPGTDRMYVSLFPLDAIGVPKRVQPLLYGIGVKTCGDLATLTRESVEVRLGNDAVDLWHLARAEDTRCDTLFAPMPRELPHATLEWMDYEVTDPARLLFVLNALLENVCDALAAEGQGAREMSIDFALTNKTTHVEPVRAARPSASRHTWMRLVRSTLDRITLSASVTGIALRVTRVSDREERQTDLFDRGLATVAATEDVIARLMEDQKNAVVVPTNSGHPLLDMRTMWTARSEETIQRLSDSVTGNRRIPQSPNRSSLLAGSASALTLQLAPIPQPVSVVTAVRRDHFMPVRFRDRAGWHEIVNAAGPDRVSGGKWDGARTYAREYFRCVTHDGAVVWLFRSVQGKQNAWYLHGWWD